LSGDARFGQWVQADPLRSFKHKEGTTMKKIDITKLPELATKVGIHGSLKQREVGGAACGSIIVAVITG
jgi:hypothetical protein